MAALEFDAITKAFPRSMTALDRFTLAVADRELVVLVGPSGAGKTTALRIAAGLERATSGSIRLDGQRIDDWRPRDRDLAMVFQQPALYPHLTVRKNAAFSLRMRRAPREEIDRRVAKAAGNLGIAELLDRYPGTLSGGEAQRAALARALVRRPKALLLDEPFASLDAPLRVELRRELLAAHLTDPVTTVFVTHDQDEALALAERLVVLRAGRVEQIGTPQEVYERPANRFVAAFLGSPPMNFLAGALTSNDGRVYFEQPGLRFALGASTCGVAAAIAGPQIVLGVRPQHVFTAGSSDAAGADTSFDATVIEREFSGDGWLVRYRTSGGDLLCSIFRDGPPPAVGQVQSLRFAPHGLHCFAADELGKRLHDRWAALD